MAEKYDPDRMNADDIDPDDPDAVAAWLDHPNTKAVHDDLARMFRQEPTKQQQAQLQRMIDADEARLGELKEALSTRTYDPEVREALELLRTTLEETIARARLRMLELDIDGPDQPT